MAPSTGKVVTPVGLCSRRFTGDVTVQVLAKEIICHGTSRRAALEIDRIRAAVKSIIVNGDVGGILHRYGRTDCCGEVQIVVSNDNAINCCAITRNLYPVVMRIAWSREIMNPIVFNQSTIRFAPNAVFNAANVTASNNKARITNYYSANTRIPAPAYNIAIFNRDIMRMDVNIVHMTISDRHAKVVDNNDAVDIKPINDLSIGA